MSRFVVTELEGYASPREGSGGKPGLSCHVIDTLWNHRLIHTYRTEIGHGASVTGRPRATVRRLAAEHAARLEAGVTTTAQAERKRDRWPCPRCGKPIHESHSRCTACGTRMR